MQSLSLCAGRGNPNVGKQVPAITISAESIRVWGIRYYMRYHYQSHSISTLTKWFHRPSPRGVWSCTPPERWPLPDLPTVPWLTDADVRRNAARGLICGEPRRTVSRFDIAVVKDIKYTCHIYQTIQFIGSRTDQM